MTKKDAPDEVETRVPHSPNRKRPRLISLGQISHETGVPAVTLRRVLAAAGLEAVRLTDARNGKVYYRTEEIERWLHDSQIIQSPTRDGLRPDHATGEGVQERTPSPRGKEGRPVAAAPAGTEARR